jgi:hypothetical protein
MTLAEFCDMAEAVLALADNSEQGTGICEAHATALLIILLKRNRIHMPSELAAHREQVRMQADITDAVKMAAASGKLQTHGFSGEPS